MATLLYISISPRGNDSISRQLGNAGVEASEFHPETHLMTSQKTMFTPFTAL